MRSFLFVPADDPRKLAKATQSSAHALVLDLEDAVLPERKAAARKLLAEWAAPGDAAARLWVRINEPDSTAQLEDLAAVTPLRPVGVVLPKIRGPEDIGVVSHYLDMAEKPSTAFPWAPSRSSRSARRRPRRWCALHELAARLRGPRLAGLMWGGEDLSSALGADASTYKRRRRLARRCTSMRAINVCSPLTARALDVRCHRHGVTWTSRKCLRDVCVARCRHGPTDSMGK